MPTKQQNSDEERLSEWNLYPLDEGKGNEEGVSKRVKGGYSPVNSHFLLPSSFVSIPFLINPCTKLELMTVFIIIKS